MICTAEKIKRVLKNEMIYICILIYIGLVPERLTTKFHYHIFVILKATASIAYPLNGEVSTSVGHLYNGFFNISRGYTP